ncbi:phosphonopyruvate decarboxylase [Bacillus sp. OV322]|uniref:phosphonopyruvate decarboxylase n=1 Tax=Bacillus sp. OV322 TaxID=1882764 RepID=UPI0008E3A5A6|nr:phosphonopyruvate decarboxylase [Bacillus sp. OV322]SFC10136.1 phosphonopyruvate decarboxylase [Bacillus sp. OV322]
MLDTHRFGEELRKLGFSFFTGVPCSFLKPLINFAINECDYVGAANEGDAVAIASGAFLGGQKSVVLMQNSGLANAVSPLTSLNYPFRLPVLGFVSLRGEPGLPDEPQHELMGKISPSMLDLMEIEWEYLSPNFEESRRQLERANFMVESNKTFFFVVKKNTFAEELLKKQEPCSHQNMLKVVKSKEDQVPARIEALAVINSLKDQDTVQIASTGKTGRELYEVEDARNNLYMVGSMGCANSLGLGLARVKKEKDIIVIEGDGALLMRMGSLATNGYYAQDNMLHIILDNQSHDSTGGQSTVSHNVNFVEMAAASGYSKAVYVHNLSELKAWIMDWKREKGLTFLYIQIAKGSKKNLGRPKIKPHEVKERLKVFLDE